ncbi:class I SAM-dependent methyltransferase [Candidatus Uhrbacteria bacterium]|nr:class I SAM-dependent methyltransferase [Candidatus Uhrbacteria bacterium]
MNHQEQKRRAPGSFRDPAGFVYTRGGAIYRQINDGGREAFEMLSRSGCYGALIRDELLIPHEAVDRRFAWSDDAYAVIQPMRVPMVSYPYEWCFSQLKDAALATLRVQRCALSHGMSLRDASAYNIQFIAGKPVFIDTLSFERYHPGVPWVAYRQFCQHFLAPLALMSMRDIRLSQLLRVYLDGIPLDLAARLLPLRAKIRPGLFFNLLMHARAQRRYAGGRDAVAVARRQFSERAFCGLLDGLEMTIGHLRWAPVGTEWAEYDIERSYDRTAFVQKRALVEQFLVAFHPSTVWDLGANTGTFSRIASAHGAQTTAFDIDPAAVERNYLDVRVRGEKRILPLLLDLTNPSPGTGWAHAERESFIARGPADCVLALALIHHLAIGNNVPLGDIAEFLHRIARALIIEFVSKEDPRVQQLLRSRTDVFPSYTQESFERAFDAHFVTERIERIGTTPRTLYAMCAR